jgi:hypothetical protein
LPDIPLRFNIRNHSADDSDSMQHDKQRETKAEDDDWYHEVYVGQNGFCLR